MRDELDAEWRRDDEFVAEVTAGTDFVAAGGDHRACLLYTSDAADELT
mgnify:CR=1 FL=1